MPYDAWLKAHPQFQVEDAGGQKVWYGNLLLVFYIPDPGIGNGILIIEQVEDLYSGI